MVSRLFGLHTSDDAIKGPFFDRSCLHMANDWYPSEPATVISTARDKRHKGYKVSPVGGYIGGIIESNGGQGYLNRADLVIAPDYLPITVSQAAVVSGQRPDATRNASICEDSQACRVAGNCQLCTRNRPLE